jgi:hypothetical protein
VTRRFVTATATHLAEFRSRAHGSVFAVR